ncbi:WcaI family glycosyltransferase [Flavivirga abyssicola]|uniref:WcaI family glycosyltransferase n=1 Tax=Flavivirga abyssicola TaxID=3063533 RepID=UPI0026DF3178|nr:WcaI family glycosyltransferase [Flavivirga sp. MEBiC07777]WVK14788.1 WcaI family glycosyltransferase [Flavivirga sp. MEBiC07777]
MNKITLISGYYYPEDTAIGLYNKQMVDYLTGMGYDVNIITGFPSYPQWKIRDDYKKKKTFLKEKDGNSTIYRYKQYVPSKPTFFKRILLLLDFTLGSFINVFKIKECDIVISVVPHTSTIFLGWILKRRRKAKLWNHIQDFEFDAVKETGLTSGDNIIKKSLFNLLFRMEKRLLNQGDINSTISHRMISHLKDKSNSDSFYFPNWIDVSKINPSNYETHDYLKSSRFKILYSGNIGDKQDWDFFVLFAKKLMNLEVEILVVGDGAKREWLCDNIRNFDNVKYYPPVKYSELSSLLCSADLHILFQKNNVVDSVMPSKLLGMMASSRPSLITGGDGSEVKVVVNNSNGGVYLSNVDVEECVSVVKSLLNSKEKLLDLGLNARNYIVKHFSSNEVLQSFENKLSEIV